MKKILLAIVMFLIISAPAFSDQGYLSFDQPISKPVYQDEFSKIYLNVHVESVKKWRYQYHNELWIIDPWSLKTEKTIDMDGSVVWVDLINQDKYLLTLDAYFDSSKGKIKHTLRKINYKSGNILKEISTFEDVGRSILVDEKTGCIYCDVRPRLGEDWKLLKIDLDDFSVLSQREFSMEIYDNRFVVIASAGSELFIRKSTNDFTGPDEKWEYIEIFDTETFESISVLNLENHVTRFRAGDKNLLYVSTINKDPYDSSIVILDYTSQNIAHAIDLPNMAIQDIYPDISSGNLICQVREKRMSSEMSSKHSIVEIDLSDFSVLERSVEYDAQNKQSMFISEFRTDEMLVIGQDRIRFFYIEDRVSVVQNLVFPSKISMRLYYVDVK